MKHLLDAVPLCLGGSAKAGSSGAATHLMPVLLAHHHVEARVLASAAGQYKAFYRVNKPACGSSHAMSDHPAACRRPDVPD